jgi:hypothetical protein
MAEHDDLYRRLTMIELIERSSLGTPEVKAIRALCPLWVKLVILAEVYRDVA